jgi:hypothetical protein
VLAVPAAPAATAAATATATATATAASARGPAPAPVPARAQATTGGGNGIEKLSARKIADKAEKALLNARSLHVRLTDTAAGDSRHRPSQANLTLDRQGNCTGSLTFGQGGSVELVKRGDEVWLRADEQFWKKQVPGAGGVIDRVVGDRYVHGNVDNAFLKKAARFCDLDTFRSQIKAATTGAGTLDKGRPTTVSGTRTVPLTGKQGDRSSTVYVSAEGTAYPLKAVVKGESVAVTTTLSGFNKPVPSKTPSSSDSVDVSKLTDRLPG